MGTIENKLSYLLRTKEEIRNAINGKGVKVTEQDTFRSYADKIRAIVGTEYYVPSLNLETVNFKDYDGGVLHAYTKDEFLALTEMPALPSRPRLVCQGWNWSLEDAKAYVQEYGRLDIGATYITDDGKTRFYIKVEGERKSFPFKFSIDKANSLVIDWGDGATERISGSGSLSASHIYDAVGDYVISLEVAEGSILTLTGPYMNYAYQPILEMPYSSMLKKTELGERVSIGIQTFSQCYALSSVVIPNGITRIGNYAFNACYSLSSIVIPNGVTSIDQQAFYQCSSLSSVIIPSSVTSIGSSAFVQCYPLLSVMIPNGVTSINNQTFLNCYSLSTIIIPNGVTSIGQQAFNQCYSLSSVVIPGGITSTGNNAFYNCSSLSSVVISNGVKSISQQSFYGCFSLSSVVIPSSVTSIGVGAFTNCNSVAFYDFRSHTSVPTLSNNSVFSSLASDCKFVVPDELYDSWIAATNWSSYASYIIKASEFNG